MRNNVRSNKMSAFPETGPDGCLFRFGESEEL